MTVILDMRPRNTGGNGSVAVYAAPLDSDTEDEINTFIAMCKDRGLDPADEILKAIQRAHDAMLEE